MGASLPRSTKACGQGRWSKTCADCAKRVKAALIQQRREQLRESQINFLDETVFKNAKNEFSQRRTHTEASKAGKDMQLLLRVSRFSEVL